MAFDEKVNLADTSVVIAPSPPTTGTTLSVEPGNGEIFPKAPFYAVICGQDERPLHENAEIIRVTAKNVDTFTILRAQEGTKARMIATGDQCFSGDVAGSWNAVYAAIEANEAAIVAEVAARKAAVTSAESTAVAEVKVETERAEGAEGVNATAITTETSRAEAAETLKAPIANPTLTGVPAAPTAAAKTNTTQLATTAFAQTVKGEAETSAKGTSEAGVKVEKERAETAEALKAPLASPALTGTPTVPTATAGTNTTQAASTAFTTGAVKTEKERAETAEGLLAPLASPTFTGTPAAPTPTASDSTTKLATTAFVAKAVAAAVEGLVAHPNVLYTTVAALPTNVYLAGVITGSAVGALTVDGESPTTGNRILVKNEVAESHNGLYTVTHAGGVAEAFVLTRATDMNEGTEVENAYTFVEGGKTQKNSGWFVAAPGPFTLGTTAIPWARLPGSGDFVAGEGISITGNQIAVSSSVVSNRVKALGNISGAVTLNFAEGSVFTMTLTGNTTIKNLTNCLPTGQRTEALLVVFSEGHTLTFEAGVFGALQPEVNPEGGQATQIPIVTETAGASFLPVPNRGETGPSPFTAIGAWVSGGSYVAKPPASVVESANALYLCTAPVTGSTTPPQEDAVHWLKILKGPTGEKGTTGNIGPEGLAGAQAKVKALGEVSGVTKLSIQKLREEGFGAISALTVGVWELKTELWPEGIDFEMPVFTEQDATGHVFTVPGVIWPESEPAWATTPKAVNNFVLASPNGGFTVFGAPPPQKGTAGTNGTDGTNGATGPEGKAGAWTAITLGAKLLYVEGGENRKAEARSEGGASRGWLCGNLECKEEVKTSDTVLTLPEALWPKKEERSLVVTTGAVVRAITISKAGVLKLTAALASGVIELGTVTWILG